MGEPLISKDLLERLYIDEKKSMKAISKQLNVAIGSVYKYCKLYDIQSRKTGDVLKGRKLSKEECERISRIHKGKKLTEEHKRKIAEGHKKGGIGHKKKRSDGYIAVYFPDHPKSNLSGYIMEHVLVMECLVGRPLKDDEVVHHKNHKRDDNRKENLQLMTKSEHTTFHLKERYENRRNLNNE